MATTVSDSPKLWDIDKNEKNKFQCDWLGKKINLKLGEKETDASVGESIKKIDVSGKVLCILCNGFIRYVTFQRFGIGFYLSWDRCKSALKLC
ncbi:hypothetical protein AVEN_122395-1 [Araneus ventricosus]|uniref:Uncharacterized protein n=1 Tax=Araneus ventricosus TaxID=182803 RepID=A0A4Y2SBT6_ARAVE|nr:hypothetical protein AVEN_122395-1 [Araneus ventricosus]